MRPYRSRARGAAALLALVLVPWVLGPWLLGPPAFAQSGGLTLQAALAALPSSPGWQKADLDYQSALDALASARAAAGLSISAGGSYSRSDVVAGSGGHGGASAKLSVTASTTVLPWAPADTTLANAELAVQQAALTRDSARRGLVLTLEQQYFAARQAGLAADVARAAADQAQAKLAAARQQHAQGQLSAAGLAQSEAAAANANATLAQARSSLDLARRSLFATLGEPPSDAALTSAPPQASGPSAPLAQLVSSAVGQRDDVKIAQLKVEQAQRVLSASAAERWIPSASLNLGVAGADANGAPAGLGVSAGLDLQKGVLSGTASYPVAPGNGVAYTQLSIGASVSVPLDAPSASAAIHAGQTSVKSAQAALAATRSAAELDIRQRYAAWQGAQATLAADRAAEAAAQRSLDTAQARLRAGLATSLDVGDARLAYRQAQRTVASDANALYLALLQLRNALGELKAPPGGQS